MNAPLTNNPIFIYKFNDSSTPPEYHRSYTISVSPDSVHLSVDSYGSVLLDKSFSLKHSDYQSFVAALLALNITNHEAPELRPRPGSTSDFLHIYLSEGIAVKGEIYHGGGQSFGTLAGDVDEAVRLFKELIPDLQKLVSGAGKKKFWF